MEMAHPNCCGLDVHQKTVTACVRQGRRSQLRTFRTVTCELAKLGQWLNQTGCTHVAMESTGVYWKPIWNLLEGRFALLLVNAAHIKAVPGRKSDIKDAEWIAQLLQHGLLRASFVPPRPIRRLRDLTRHRTKLVQQRTAVVNRIHKVLEDANIKLASVASDAMGASGKAMIEAMIEGQEDASALAEMAKGKLRAKLEELTQALEGRVGEHHRFLLERLMAQYAYLQEEIGLFSARIQDKARPFAAELERLDTIPGVNLIAAANILAEVGPDMSVFPSHGHLVSWACVCPGSDESAGKHRSGKCRKGNRWLRGTLAEAAWAASKTDTYLGAMYRRIARKRGKKRAIVAVSRHILIIVYHILRDKIVYKELGADHFERRNAQRIQKYLIGRLEALGLRVNVEPAAVPT